MYFDHAMHEYRSECDVDCERVRIWIFFFVDFVRAIDCLVLKWRAFRMHRTRWACAMLGQGVMGYGTEEGIVLAAALFLLLRCSSTQVMALKTGNHHHRAHSCHTHAKPFPFDFSMKILFFVFFLYFVFLFFPCRRHRSMPSEYQTFRMVQFNCRCC